MADSFYEPTGPDTWRATELTRGPWDPGMQHAGPPAALLGRLMTEAEGGGGKRLVRVTQEILSPIPAAELRVTVEVERPGRRVDLVSGRIATEDGTVALARGWRIRTGHLEVPEVATAGRPPPGPDEGRPPTWFDTPHDVGWHSAFEFRTVAGDWTEPGPATMWFRLEHGLLPGEEPDPLTRVLAAADAGNGASASLDWADWLFINTEITVHLHRLPDGPWVCLDAATTLSGDATGLATTTIYDTTSAVGTGAQSLFVAERTPEPSP